jgi:hypothetical protein
LRCSTQLHSCSSSYPALSSPNRGLLDNRPSGGVEFFIVNSWSHGISSLDPTTGKIHWQERIGGDYFSSPVQVADRVYCISREGAAVRLPPSRPFNFGRLFVGPLIRLFDLQRSLPRDGLQIENCKLEIEN